jgi:tyrosine decarboxylase/aspartate 1-decarboxylase
LKEFLGEEISFMELSARGKSPVDIVSDLDHRLMGISSDEFPNFGKSRTSILSDLDLRLSEDWTYSSGHILGAMTTQPHEFARAVFSRYLERNLGDSGLVPATKALEHDLIHILGSLLGDPNVDGNMVSGGTEANIVAIHLAKKIAGENINNPEIVVPDSAHYSFDKAADLFGVKVRRAPLDQNFNLDFGAYKELVTEKTVALIGISGTTALGLIDPLEKIGDLAHKHHIYYHVDGAFGGLNFPFLRALGHNLPPFDLSIKNITSFTVDPHKAMGIIPSGILLIRDASLTDLGYSIPYLAGGGCKSLNITGTRPGASVISFWALVQYLGMDGFKNIVKECWENTIYLKEAIQNIPQLSLATEPITNIVGLKLTNSANIDIEHFGLELRHRGWALGIFKQYGFARVVLMPHVKREHIDAFLTDIRKIFQ